MTVLIYMLPAAIMLAAAALGAFVWALRNGQFDDPRGDSERILTDQNEPL